jgi:glucan phosphorylase
VVEIQTRGGSIRAKVWRLKVGRCDLLLLDSNVAGNAPEDRELTSRLYGGDGARAFARSCCWAWAAFARSRRWASRRECCI